MHEQHIGAHVAIRSFFAVCIMRGGRRKGGRRIDPCRSRSYSRHAPGRKGHPCIALSAQITFIGCDGCGLTRQSFIVEVVAFKVAAPGALQVAQHLDIFR